MSSILTNSSAMVALQTMKGINSNLNQVQNEISTGKSVSSAKDNAAVWSISKTMESDVSNFETIGENLSLGQSTVSVAREAATSVTDRLTEMKNKIVSAQGKTGEDQKTIQADIDALKEQIKSTVDSAQFNGVNLVSSDDYKVDDADATSGYQVLSSLNRGTDGTVTTGKITVSGQNLSQDAGGGLEGLADITLTPAAGEELDIDALLTQMDTLIGVATDAAASFGSKENQLTMQSDFVSKLSDAVETGIGAMVDADMEEASARLQALQVQQQLSTQSLSIANQAPQSILSLFQ
ncbi:flagellin [Falsirhodobacter sp. 1013]|uniref:flagellin N-terminal helical domain-containing protein n=1 Tax=Falsirhodobacter sp. 1013 TaxID=3417566 RepID=UPI003EB706BE